MRRQFLIAASALMLLAPWAGADWNEEAAVRFREPIAIPGITLKPGTYIFKGFDSSTDEGVVQIFTKNGLALIATLETLPVCRRDTRSHTTISLEREQGEEAVHELFFRNDKYGHEFVYNRR
jgi:hypothetical protein